MPREARSETETGESGVDLTEAARAVVRDPGDPRIDAHLAALGLGDDGRPGTGSRARDESARARGESAGAAELAELRGRIGELEGQLQASRARGETLLLGLAAAALAILVLSAILLFR